MLALTHIDETHNDQPHNEDTHNEKTHNVETHKDDTYNDRTHNDETRIFIFFCLKSRLRIHVLYYGSSALFEQSWIFC